MHIFFDFVPSQEGRSDAWAFWNFPFQSSPSRSFKSGCCASFVTVFESSFFCLSSCFCFFAFGSSLSSLRVSSLGDVVVFFEGEGKCHRERSVQDEVNNVVEVEYPVVYFHSRYV